MKPKIYLPLDKQEQELEKALYQAISAAFIIASKKIIADYQINDYSTFLDKIQKDKGRVQAIVNSIINQMYYDSEKEDYLFLSSKILKEISTKHPFYNYNKRTSFWSAKIILKQQMVEIFFSSVEATEFMLKVIENHEKRLSEEKQMTYIVQEILKHSTIEPREKNDNAMI